MLNLTEKLFVKYRLRGVVIMQEDDRTKHDQGYDRKDFLFLVQRPSSSNRGCLRFNDDRQKMIAASTITAIAAQSMICHVAR
jgi:hypothetical protein